MPEIFLGLSWNEWKFCENIYIIFWLTMNNIIDKIFFHKTQSKLTWPRTILSVMLLYVLISFMSKISILKFYLFIYYLQDTVKIFWQNFYSVPDGLKKYFCLKANVPYGAFWIISIGRFPYVKPYSTPYLQLMKNRINISCTVPE